MRRNETGQKFYVSAFNDDGYVSGDAANITCQISKDAGTLTALDDTNPTEIGSTGRYVFDATQAETNATTILVVPASSTSGVTVMGSPELIYTTPTGSGVATVSVEPGGSVTASEGIELILYVDDDYTGDFATTIFITSSDDQSSNSLILAAQKDATTEFAYRMPIVGAVGSQYALFDPAGTITDDWEPGDYTMILRLETATDVYHRIGGGVLRVRPFETPTPIVDI